jgi:hypothetical protein
MENKSTIGSYFTSNRIATILKKPTIMCWKRCIKTKNNLTVQKVIIIQMEECLHSRQGPEFKPQFHQKKKKKSYKELPYDLAILLVGVNTQRN